MHAKVTDNFRDSEIKFFDYWFVHKYNITLEFVQMHFKVTANFLVNELKFC
jgi:hypothetical protein